MNTLKETLMERDDLTEIEAEELICSAQARIREGANPEDVLQEDFLFDLIETMWDVKVQYVG